MSTRAYEFGLFYGVLPIAFAIAAHRLDYRGAMVPVLWLVSLCILLALYLDPTFDAKVLWALPLDAATLEPTLLRFAGLGSALLLYGRWLSPGSFLDLPRKRPRLWLMFVVGYPLLSAVPQGLIWRVFLAHRYASLFGDQITLVCFGAAAFSLAHLAFWNLTAIAVTALGGALFLWTYLHTHSMLLAAFEHGAYGIVAFSAGFGPYLYRGARRITPPAGSQVV